MRIKVWWAGANQSTNQDISSINITRLDIQITNTLYLSDFLNSFNTGSISSPSVANLANFTAIWDPRRNKPSVHLVNFLLTPDPFISSYSFRFTVRSASLTWFCNGACNYALFGVNATDGRPFCSTGSLGYIPIITTDWADFDLSRSQGSVDLGSSGG